MKAWTIDSLRTILEYLHEEQEKRWKHEGGSRDDYLFHEIADVTDWLDSGGD